MEKKKRNKTRIEKTKVNEKEEERKQE